MDDLMSVFQDLDLSGFLPEADKFVRSLEGWTRVLLLAPPLIVALLGVWYFFKPPAEANHKAGFRCIFSMGSVEAWLYSQHLAGLFYMIVGGALFVLMLIISLFFNGNNATAMISTALLCAVVEAVVILVLHIFLIMLIGRTYDKDGNRRK